MESETPNRAEHAGFVERWLRDSVHCKQLDAEVLRLVRSATRDGKLDSEALVDGLSRRREEASDES